MLLYLIRGCVVMFGWNTFTILHWNKIFSTFLYKTIKILSIVSNILI